MRTLVLVLTVTVVSVSGCAGPSASTPAPTAAIESLATLKARVAETQAAMPTETRVPATDRPAPTVTPRSVPSDPDAFAQYMIETYREIGGADLGVTGEYVWLPGSPNHLILDTSISMFDSELIEVDEDVKEAWLAEVIRDMEAFAGGEEWWLWYGFDRVETNAAQAGERSVEWKDWMYISDEYDPDVGGFRTTEYPVTVKRESDGRMRSQIFVNRFDRMIGYYDQYLR